jgi:hypothetical protein
VSGCGAVVIVEHPTEPLPPLHAVMRGGSDDFGLHELFFGFSSA